MMHTELAMVVNGDAHSFGRWLACPTCASTADLSLVTDADDVGTIGCKKCEIQIELTGIPKFLQWVQCPACGFGSTVQLSLDSNGDLLVECFQCSRLYRAGESDGDSSA